MNTRFIRISLKKRIFISYCLIGLFFFLGENCYASKRPVFRETVRKASADNSTVRGRVVDVSGEPLIGATIREKGGTRGTVTDIEGNFILSVPDSAVLQVSFVGYESIEVSVGGRKTLEILLRENTVMLDNVIITALGLEKKEASLAYSIQKVKGEELTRMKEGNMITALAGKAAGVQINKNSSGIGGSAKVSLRGIRSASGDNQPLYVIDNIPQASTGEFSSSGISGDFQIAQDPLSSLNPADIEDITILKDASSTAIYGSRGANGVILITTKKGKEGKAKVNASATFTIANASRLLEMMNLEEYAAYHNSRITDGKVPFHIVGDEVRYVFNGAYDKYDPADPETYNVVNYRNWQKEIYTSAFSQNYSLSVNGGAGKTTYYISANFKA